MIISHPTICSTAPWGLESGTHTHTHTLVSWDRGRRSRCSDFTCNLDRIRQSGCAKVHSSPIWTSTRAWLQRSEKTIKSHYREPRLCAGAGEAVRGRRFGPKETDSFTQANVTVVNMDTPEPRSLCCSQCLPVSSAPPRRRTNARRVMEHRWRDTNEFKGLLMYLETRVPTILTHWPPALNPGLEVTRRSCDICHVLMLVECSVDRDFPSKDGGNSN